MREEERKVDEVWSANYSAGIKKADARDNWWQSPQIIRHINKTICGEPLDGWNSGGIKLLKQILPEEGMIERALSIGCGLGSKEMGFVEENLVKEFICFDLSEEAVRIGRQRAEEKGLSDRMLFLNEDFFESGYADGAFDMVFWDNSLHHMPDAAAAVRKSYDVLKEGGIFFCNDFVGRNRFQWWDMEMIIANGVRAFFSDDLFVRKDGRRLPRCITRPSLEAMLKADPSEAADSEAILPAIYETFKEPLVIPTGGIVYHLAIQFILENIPEDGELLTYLLQLDDEAVQMGMTCYAFALAVK